MSWGELGKAHASFRWSATPPPPPPTPLPWTADSGRTRARGAKRLPLSGAA